MALSHDEIVASPNVIEERFKGGKTVRVRQVRQVRQYTNKISAAAAKTRSNEIEALPLLVQHSGLRVPEYVTVLESAGIALSTHPYIWYLPSPVVSYVILKFWKSSGLSLLRMASLLFGTSLENNFKSSAPFLLQNHDIMASCWANISSIPGLRGRSVAASD